MDSSRVSTFLISILLIVYGSFRSLNMEQEAREREKEKERKNLLSGIVSGTGGADSSASSGVQTLDTMHALCLPLGASISLLIMFFFFDSMQMLFAICTASKFNCYYNYLSTSNLPFLFNSYCDGCTSISSSTYVPVYHTTVFRWKQNIIWSLREVYQC